MADLKKNGILDLFCGPGGFSLGFLQAGFDVLYSIDNNQYAIETIRSNHEEIYRVNRKKNIHSAVVQDIVNADYDIISNHFSKHGYQVSGIIGGPPCQGFSTSNKQTRSWENPQNLLFREYLRIVDYFQPDFFAFENVLGIMSVDGGNAIKEIWQKLHGDLGYCLGKFILDASNFGVPQIRKRVIILGFKSEKLKSDYILDGGLNEELTFQPSNNSKKVTLKEAIADLPEIGSGNRKNIMNYRHGKPYKYASNLRFTPELNMKSSAVLNHVNTKNSDEIIERYKHIPEGGNWADIPDSLLQNYSDKSRCHSGIYKRLREDNPSVTINNIRKSMYIHPTQNRGLSIREAARIQSFPDWYEFKGPLMHMQQMVADAVPPLMAKAIAEQVREILRD